MTTPTQITDYWAHCRRHVEARHRDGKAWVDAVISGDESGLDSLGSVKNPELRLSATNYLQGCGKLDKSVYGRLFRLTEVNLEHMEICGQKPGEIVPLVLDMLREGDKASYAYGEHQHDVVGAPLGPVDKASLLFLAGYFKRNASEQNGTHLMFSRYVDARANSSLDGDVKSKMLAHIASQDFDRRVTRAVTACGVNPDRPYSSHLRLISDVAAPQ